MLSESRESVCFRITRKRTLSEASLDMKEGFLNHSKVSRVALEKLQCVAVCCSVLQRVAVSCSVLQYVAVCCSVLQCVAVCCSVLQCAAACCSVLQKASCVAHENKAFM